MRKFLSVILSLSIVLSISAVEIPIARGAETNQQQSLQEGLWSYEIYEYDGITGAIITGYNGSASDIYVPSSIGDGSEKLPVLKLGDGLFQDNTAVNSVTLGKGIRVIGENAFSGASGLVCIVTDEELAEIGTNAFNGCTSFNSVILYDAITSIGGNAFAGCKNLTIYCNEGTIGYEYAQSNGIATEILNPDAVPETVVEDGAMYYISNGEAILMNYTRSEQVIIKPYIKGCPVTSINVSLSSLSSDSGNTSKVTELYLPDTIKIIPDDLDISKSTVIFCGSGSSANLFAELHNIPYILTEYGTLPKTITDGDFTYYIINDEYAVLKSCSSSVSKEVSVPESINGFPVTGIWSYAFDYCSEITSVNLPENVYDIFPYAFQGCEKLENINIPNSVTTIRECVFRYCGSLKSITFPDNLKRIEKEAFFASGLESISLPDGTEFIGASAFSRTKLNEMTIPKKAVIQSGAFVRTDITKVYVPADVQEINYDAFYFDYDSSYDQNNMIIYYVYDNSPVKQYCEDNNLFYHVVDGGTAEPYEYDDEPYEYDDAGNYTGYRGTYLILNNKAILLKINYSNTATINIPESVNNVPVTAIADWAFLSAAESLKKVTLPESITYIGKSAFRDCNLLEDINIPSGVTIIEDNTFYGCSNLKSLELPEVLLEIRDHAFSYCGIENVTFPESLVRIGREAFSNSRLKKLDYPNIDIGNWAFQNCTNLSEVTIQDGVTSLPERVFEGCEQLKYVHIPVTVQEFGYYAFWNCPRLILIVEDDYYTNPAVRYAKEHGVMFCTDFYASYLKTNEYTYNSINYYLVFNFCGDYVNGAVVLPGEYKFSDKITIPESIIYEGQKYRVMKIGDSAFADTNITGIELPDTLKTIGDLAFRGCHSLAEINIPENVETIGATALAASGLTGTLIYPKCNVGSAAFGTTNYDTVYVPEGVTVLPKYIFFNTPKLEYVTLPNSLESIGEYAFDITYIKNLVIPGKVVLEKKAFQGLIKLEKLVISEGMTSLAENFRGCENLRLVYLPKSLTHIDYESFSQCPNAVFCVYENSYAHEFVKKKGLPYFILGTKKNPEIAYGAEISGRAVYTDGTPVSNSTVDILYDDGTLKESVTTDENGAYSFTYAEVGRYTIRVTDSEGRSGSEQVFVKRKNVFDVFLAGTTDITVKSSWSVSGTVTPQGSACITLTDTDGNIITSVQTDNGEYTISGVPNGSYIIKAETENGSAVREITVFNGDVTGTDISIEQQAASIEGYVEVEDRSLERSRRNWVQITVYNSEGTVAASGKTDENGKYSFSNLPFGSYSIAAEVTEVRPEHKKNYKRAFTLTGYAYITLNEAKLYTVDTIVLTEESDDVAVISGKVTAHGQGQAGEVILTNVFRNEIARCSVGSNGKYSFKNVRDGLYFITAVTKSDGMGFAAVTVKHGTVYGNTNIVVYKGEKITEHEEYMRNIPPCANRDEALAYKDKIMEEKSFYDGLSEKEKKQFSYEYTERLNRLSEYISSCECSANGGDLSQGGMIISADELNSEKPVQLELNIEKREPWTIGDGGIQTDEEFMQQSIEDVKGDKTAAQYYDITLSKNIGGVEKQITDVKKDTDTTGKIRVTIPIPEEYKGHKKYSFVHVHNGIAVTLVDLDDDPDTVTFEIDKFSTFVLTYSDTEDTVEYPAKISYADGKITVTSTEEASVYIASYKDGKLISVNKSDIEANGADSFDFDETNAAFVWDKNFRPLCEKYKLESTGN